MSYVDELTGQFVHEEFPVDYMVRNEQGTVEFIGTEQECMEYIMKTVESGDRVIIS